MKNKKEIYYLYRFLNLLKIIFFFIFTSLVLLFILPAFETLISFPTIKTNVFQMIFARQYFSKSLSIIFIFGVVTLFLFIINSYLIKKYKKEIDYWTLK